MQLSSLSPLQRAGLIQYFEMTFELGWKTLKAVMTYEGLSQLNTPRDVIKHAFESDLIIDGQKIENIELNEQINRVVQVFYERKN